MPQVRRLAPLSDQRNRTFGKYHPMAKVVAADRLVRPVPVWTVDPLLSRGPGQEDPKTGVENPAFYDSETGLCSKVDPYKKKQNSWSDDTSYTKKQYNGRLIFLLVSIFILLAVLVAMVTTVVYLAVGEVRMSVHEGEEFKEEAEEEGFSLVEGHLRITNRVFTKDLLDPRSKAFLKLASQVRLSMDAVFLHTIQNYNVTRVLDYREGSVIARCHIHFSKPHVDVTHQVGLAVIQALERHHGYLPGGVLQVDIRSLHFTGLPSVPDSVSSDVVRIPEMDQWSEWSNWSPCAAPCEMQTRYRRCNKVVVGCIGSDREMRNCSCDPNVSQMELTTISSTAISEIRECSGDCEDGQICLFLSQTSISRCLVPRDTKDPTGCGGWCVGEHQLCKRVGNSTYQCADNAASCKEGEWQCDNGLCIAASGRCNSRIECYDMSDELNCECGENHFLCGNSTPCIPASLKCNGKVDCWDASDEMNCTKSCQGDKFTCNFGGCVDIILFCDRFPDCADGSDEPEGCNEPCLPTQKQCLNGRCVDNTLWCNGDDNCRDGTDETNCETLLKESSKP